MTKDGEQGLFALAALVVLATAVLGGRKMPKVETFTRRFMDPAKKDFRLRPDSPAWKLGFKPIDLTDVGLTADFPARYR